MKKLAGLLTVAHVSRYFGQVAVLLGVTVVGTPSEVGNYVLGMALAGPIFVVAGLGMRTVVLTHSREYTLRRFLQVRTFTAAVAAAVTTLVALVVLDESLRPIVFWIVIAKVSELYLDLASAWWQRRGQPNRLAALSLGSAAVVSFSALCSAWSGRSASEVVLYASLAGAAWLALVVIPALLLGEHARQKRSGPREEVAAQGFWASTGDLVRSGLPLGLSYGSVNLLGAIPQYLLAAVGTLAQVGQFGVLFYLVIAGEVIVNPVVQAWLGKARDLETAGKLSVRFIRNESLRFAAGWAPLALIGIIAGGWVIPMVFGAEYEFGWLTGLVIWLILITLPFVYIGASALAVKNKYRSALFVVLPALALSAALGLLLIPALGTLGALLAYLGASLCRVLLPYAALAHNVGSIDRSKVSN